MNVSRPFLKRFQTEIVLLAEGGGVRKGEEGGEGEGEGGGRRGGWNERGGVDGKRKWGGRKGKV